MTTKFDWTAAAVHELKRLWKASNTASQCATALMETFGGTVTRNAILGKIFRLGLGRADQETLASKAAKARADKQAKALARKATKAAVAKAKAKANSKASKPKKPDAPPAPIEPPAPHPALVYDPSRPTLFSISSTCCRFPLWPDGPAPRPREAFVCGEPVVVVKGEPKVYCLTHALRMWSQDEAKARATKAEKKRAASAGDRVFKIREAA